MTKKAAYIIIFILVVFFLGKNLNPFDPRMFSFHDDTQVARVQQFALNLQNGIIPPRIAPDISYKLGFPVFNFYAPLAYWITTAIHLTGIPSPITVKTSFLLAVLFSFFFMHRFLRLFFKNSSSLLGAVTYTSSLWMAVEIFVRGNLAEIWFIALFPLAFYLITLNSKSTSKLTLVMTSFILSAVFTVHNMLSLVSLPVLIIYALTLPYKKRSFLSIFLGLGLGSYFLFPAVFEIGLTYASYVATKTRFQDHFLCLWQLWKAPSWGFGGSVAGCMNDDVSFMLGKPHIILGGGGLILYFTNMIRRKRNYQYLFISVMGVTGMFLTTYASQFIWELFESTFALFQFPWRFLVFPMFSLAFFASYGLDRLHGKLKEVLAFSCIALLLFTSSKFFSKPWLYSTNEYKEKYGNAKYIEQKAGYNMAEYLPKTADYAYWRSLEGKEPKLQTDKPAFSNNTDVAVLINEPFRKEVSVKNGGIVTLNIHYFPVWVIYVNNHIIFPKSFDKLGRPVLNLSQPSIIHIYYEQTIIQQLGNSLTLLAFLILIGILLYKTIWIKSLSSHR